MGNKAHILVPFDLPMQNSLNLQNIAIQLSTVRTCSSLIIYNAETGDNKDNIF